MTTIYIVMRGSGDESGYFESPVKAWSSQTLATDHIDKLEYERDLADDFVKRLRMYFEKWETRNPGPRSPAYNRRLKTKSMTTKQVAEIEAHNEKLAVEWFEQRKEHETARRLVSRAHLSELGATEEMIEMLAQHNFYNPEERYGYSIEEIELD